MKRNKKETVIAAISVHWYQAAIIRGLQNGKINLETDSLRDIAKKCGDKTGTAPQQAKHHLEALVKLGAIQFIHGQYVYFKDEVKRK